MLLEILKITWIGEDNVNRDFYWNVIAKKIMLLEISKVSKYKNYRSLSKMSEWIKLWLEEWDVITDLKTKLD